MTTSNHGPELRLRAIQCRGAVALMLWALATPMPATAAPTETEVKVERVRPHAERHATLRFLRENKDFIRTALDRTRQKLVTREDQAAAIDPRFLAYRDMLADVSAAKDSVALAEEARKRLDLLRSVTQLGDLEAQLDRFDRLLAAQRERLGVLQRDFTGDQRTALAVVLSGYPQGLAVGQVALTLDDGSALSVPLTPEQCQALRQGGAVQIFHGFVEPREQVVQIAMTAAGGIPAGAGFVTLDPPRDRLTLLRLDLSQVRAEDGAASIHATTWLNDAPVP